MPRAHRNTNVEFLSDLMEHSAYGPLVQAFVLQGLQQYAKQGARHADGQRPRLARYCRRGPRQTRRALRLMDYFSPHGDAVSVFHVCHAYQLLEANYNVGGWVRERPSNQRRRESIGYSDVYRAVDLWSSAEVAAMVGPAPSVATQGLALAWSCDRDYD